MKKLFKDLDKKDYFNLFFLIIIFLGIALTITQGNLVFGSNVDWKIQHYPFPEYFRMLFYKNHDLFPDFAFNIGSGQNIYYFAYYGLLNPVILVSYLLPFVPMSVYIVVSTLLLGVFSIILFYKWIKSCGFNSNLCIVMTLIFECAGPLLFHSHRHIMFINYMPFLILGLIGVKKYFEQDKKIIMILSVFLMIMTSYLYSVGGILCLTVYAVYEYIKVNKKITVKSFFKEAFKYAIYILVGILMALIILLPLVYVIKNGRIPSINKANILGALIPKLNIDFILYGPYSLGLTTVSIVSLLTGCLLKREKRFLSITLLSLIVFPIVVYLLNGGLYLDGKVLIPFLPLYVLVVGLFLNNIDELDFKKVFIIFILCFVMIFIYSNKNDYKWFSDLLLLFISFLVYKKYKKPEIIYIPLMILCTIMCLNTNQKDSLVPGEEFASQNSLKLNEIASDIAKEDKGYYRIALNLSGTQQILNKVYDVNQNVITIYSSTYNTNYNKFFNEFNNNVASRNMFINYETKNVLFETLMGVKYLITDKAIPLGYKEFKNYGSYKVYINENAFPLGYSSSETLGTNEYKKLEFPDNVYSLLDHIVIPKNTSKKYNSKLKKLDLDISKGKQENLTLTKTNGKYKIVSKSLEGGEISIKLDEKVLNKFYLLRLNVSNPNKCVSSETQGDTTIRVNGISNKLTCKDWKYFNNNYTFDYNLSGSKGFQYINIWFSQGVHTIEDVSLYSLDYDEFKNLNKNIDKFNIKDMKNDKISGDINVKKDGYFILNIPYDKGFIVKVDNKEIEYEKVNKAFIGFDIKKGYHKVDIEFVAPNSTLGKIGSAVGFILFIYIIYNEKKKSSKK